MFNYEEKLEFKFLGIDFNTIGYTRNYNDQNQIVIDCVGSGKMVNNTLRNVSKP